MAVSTFKSEYGDTYVSFSGHDMVCVAEMPLRYQGSHIKVLGSLQTITYSIHDEKTPVRALGDMNPKGYIFGPRTIAGSMIFTVFDRHWLTEFIKDYAGSTQKWDSHALSDELPPLNLTVSMANEYGKAAYLALYGVTFVNEGQVMSVNDIYTENTFQFYAMDIDYLANEDLTANKSSVTLPTDETRPNNYDTATSKTLINPSTRDNASDTETSDTATTSPETVDDLTQDFSDKVNDIKNQGLDDDEEQRKIHDLSNNVGEQANDLSQPSWSDFQRASHANQYSDRNYNSHLATGVGKEHYDAIRDIIEDKAEAKAAAVFNKFEDDLVVIDSHADIGQNAYFQPNVNGTSGIVLEIDTEPSNPRGSYSTFFHEAGHNIDWLAGNSLEYPSAQYNSSLKYFSIQYNNGAFARAIQSDVLNLMKKYEPEGIKQIIREDSDSVHDTVEISDIIEGATGGIVTVSTGHGTEYWSIGEEQLPIEAFGNYLTATLSNPNSRRLLNKYLPTASKVFDDMMTELSEKEQ